GDGLPEGEFFGVLAQYPGASGRIRDLRAVIDAAHEQGAIACIGADILALVLLKPPGEMGADVVFGSSQRFGVPIAFGGPHAGFMSVRQGARAAAPRPPVGACVRTHARAAALR